MLGKTHLVRHDLADLTFHLNTRAAKPIYVYHYSLESEEERNAIATRLKKAGITTKPYTTKMFKTTKEQCVAVEKEAGLSVTGQADQAKIRKLGGHIERY